MSVQITQAESRVMQVVWTHGPLGAEAILGEVGAAQGWGLATVRTLVDRLIRKGALESRREGARTTYVPLVSREAYVTGESQGLLDRLFGGRLSTLVGHLSRERALAPEDLARLKRLVADLDAQAEDEAS